MAVTTPNYLDEQAREHRFDGANADYRHASASAVSWGAIIAGAAAAASLSLILLILGTGLGLSSVSPWDQRGVDASTFNTSTIVWLTVTQLLASAMGGYLAGRLRTKWIDVETDEIYFRDTAHGFLAWAVASLVTAGLLASAVGSILGGGMQSGAAAARTTLQAGSTMVAHGMHDAGRANLAGSSPLPYFIDVLFRRDEPAMASTPGDILAPRNDGMRRGGGELGEVTRIFQRVAKGESLPAADLRQVGQLVALNTGISQQAAEARVTETYARLQSALQDAETAVKQAADVARKASAYAALWLFVSLLIGAFVASLSATIGGRSRDA